MANGGEGKCPLCGEPNAHSRAHCRRCRYRLPWADHAENFTAAQGELIRRDSPNLREIVPDLSPALPDQLTARSKLRGRRCRYCDKPIEMNTKNCPHCKEWLVLHGPDLDSWAPGYDARDLEKTIFNQKGCLSFCLILPVLIQKFLS